MGTVNIVIDGRKVSARNGTSILDAANQANIYIPSLCSHSLLSPIDDVKTEDFVYQAGQIVKGDKDASCVRHCDLCLVRINGEKGLVRACETEVEEGCVVTTNDDEIRKERQKNLTKILRDYNHPNICLTCDRDPRCSPFGVCVRSVNVPKRCVACPTYPDCELLEVTDHIGIQGITIPYNPYELKPIEGNPLFEFDSALCVGCLRCVRVCQDIRGIHALGYVCQEGKIAVGTRSETFEGSGCRFCLGCVEICPTGAMTDLRQKFKSLTSKDEKKEIVPCVDACPLHIDIPRYVYYASRGEFGKALKVIKEKLPFPLLCGTVCTHPCEDACRRGDLDEPVSIRAIKRFVAEYADVIDEKPPRGKTGKRVAIIGSGPAGLAAAYFLAKRGGHGVTIFEALPKPGGVPMFAIPRFRLPQKVLELEIERVRRLGVDLITDSPVKDINELFNMGFHAVLIATGAHDEVSLGIVGEESPSVMGALSMLKGVNMGKLPELGNKVVVIGGGNAAVDSARVALRIGARDVTILYRRTREEMLADPVELAQALEEGVQIMFLVSPTKIAFSDHKTILHLIRNKLTRLDRSGRRRPKHIKGSDFNMEVDTIITAIGQRPRIPSSFNLELNKNNTLKIDNETFMTSKEGVFAAGDVVSGSGTVTKAMAMAERAALSIDKYLGGKGWFSKTTPIYQAMPPILDQESTSFYGKRVPVPTLPVNEREENFNQVELGYDADMTLKEANRCLRCSLRLAFMDARSCPIQEQQIA